MIDAILNYIREGDLKDFKAYSLDSAQEQKVLDEPEVS
jgi:hypothetical protein